jgi:ABC-type Fe3+/spermidine/putrescine transport system ATPase subunit
MTGMSVRGLTLAAGPRVPPVVEDVSFSAEAGAVTAILGEAGAGKTWLLAGLAGLRRPRRGAVFVNGVDITARTAGKRGIGLLPPGEDLGAGRTVSAALRRVAGKPGAATLAALMAPFGLDHLAAAQVGGLTHGQGFAALGVARLLPPGEVLLVDDAGTGLDGAATEALRRFLWEQAACGRTVVLATRDPKLALAADALVLLQAGRVLQAGAPASVYAEPRDPQAARLTGALNLLHGVVRQKIPGGFVWAGGGRKFVQAGAGPALGAEVALMLRPEHVGLAPDGAANALPGTVTHLLCLGGRTETRLDTALGEIAMHTSGPALLRRGQAVTLGWAEAAACAPGGAGAAPPAAAPAGGARPRAAAARA